MKYVLTLLLLASGRAIDPLRSFTCADIFESFIIPDYEQQRITSDVRLCAHREEPFEHTQFWNMPSSSLRICEGVPSPADITDQEKQSLYINKNIFNYALPFRRINNVCRREVS